MSRKLLKSTSIVGFMTLFSRISGLVRDVVFANLLGDKAAADVFFIAFRIPNFFRRMTAEGAFAAAFVPIFTDIRQHQGADDTSRFLQLMVGRFGLILAIVSILGVIGAEWVVWAMAPGFEEEPEKFALTVEVTRYTFPYLFFVSLVAMAAGMLNTCERFAAPAATPVLLNICLIFAAVVLAPQFADKPIALGIGVLLAGVVQLLFQWPFLKREKLLVRPRLKSRPEDCVAKERVRQVFKLMLPAIFGVSVAQVNVLINTILASFMVTGSVSWLYYSDRLMEFPVGVFGIALGTVLLPDLSRKNAAGNVSAFGVTLDWAARWVFLICVPATVALIVMSESLIMTIYYHGDFSRHGVNMAAQSLVAYSVGLLPIVMVKVLAPGFYARKNTKTPVRIGMIAVSVNIVVSLVLFSVLHHVGLALATSIAAIVNASLLYWMLRKEQVFLLQSGWVWYLLRVLIAAGVMGFVLWASVGDASIWFERSVWNRVLWLGTWVMAGASIYFVVLLLLGIRPRMMRLSETNS